MAAKSEAFEPDDRGELADARPVCPHCLAAIGPRDHFCARCGGPLTSHASTDPLGQIFAEGYAYRQAVSGRPSALVLAGVWLIFGPQMFMAAVWLAGLVRSPVTPFGVVNEIVLVAALVLYAAILARVTRNRIVRPAAL